MACPNTIASNGVSARDQDNLRFQSKKDQDQAAAGLQQFAAAVQTLTREVEGMGSQLTAETAPEETTEAENTTVQATDSDSEETGQSAINEMLMNMSQLQITIAQNGYNKSEFDLNISNANVEAAQKQITDIANEIKKYNKQQKKAHKWGIFGKIAKAFTVIAAVAMDVAAVVDPALAPAAIMMTIMAVDQVSGGKASNFLAKEIGKGIQAIDHAAGGHMSNSAADLIGGAIVTLMAVAASFGFAGAEAGGEEVEMMEMNAEESGVGKAAGSAAEEEGAANNSLFSSIKSGASAFIKAGRTGLNPKTFALQMGLMTMQDTNMVKHAAEVYVDNNYSSESDEKKQERKDKGAMIGGFILMGLNLASLKLNVTTAVSKSAGTACMSASNMAKVIKWMPRICAGASMLELGAQVGTSVWDLKGAFTERDITMDTAKLNLIHETTSASDDSVKKSQEAEADLLKDQQVSSQVAAQLTSGEQAMAQLVCQASPA